MDEGHEYTLFQENNNMQPPSAIIFDLGGTLIDWPDWNEDAGRRWGLSYDYLIAQLPNNGWPERSAYVQAMLEAEQSHWRQVVEEQWSGPPSSLIGNGFRRLGRHLRETELLAALDGYARAVDGWAVVFPDARETLNLSNTWWAAEWHNADLAAHGLDTLIDQITYTSDLPHSKPHPSVFMEVASRLNAEVDACVMVGDRMIDDISGALGVGMRAVWKKNASPWPQPEGIVPTATITHLTELPALLHVWGGA